MDQIDDAIREIGREVGAVVGAAVFFQAAGYVDARVALGQGELYVGISFVIAQQDVEAGLLLLDEVIFERERFFVVGYDDVVDVHGFADQGAGFGVVGAALVEIGADTVAQVFGLADVDDFAFGVLVEVHAGGGGDGADFLLEIHQGVYFIDDLWLISGARVVALQSSSFARPDLGLAQDTLEDARPTRAVVIRGLRNCSDHINFPHFEACGGKRVYAVGRA